MPHTAPQFHVIPEFISPVTDFSCLTTKTSHITRVGRNLGVFRTDTLAHRTVPARRGLHNIALSCLPLRTAPFLFFALIAFFMLGNTLFCV